MKFKLLIIVFAFVPTFLFGQEISVDALLNEVDNLHNAYKKARSKEKDGIYEQTFQLYDSIYNYMADSVRYFSAYEQYEKDALAYRFFIKEDASVFSQDLMEIDIQGLPKYMVEHYTAIKKIQEYSRCIEEMEKIIRETDSNLSEADKKTIIAISTKHHIDKASDLLNAIDNLKYSLSKDQERYLQKFSDRLSDILNKYIF